MQLRVDREGAIETLYTERLDLARLGPLKVHRASDVEPACDGQWYADLARSGGPKLGPFAKRSEALRREVEWLEQQQQQRATATVAVETVASGSCGCLVTL